MRSASGKIQPPSGCRRRRPIRSGGGGTQKTNGKVGARRMAFCYANKRLYNTGRRTGQIHPRPLEIEDFLANSLFPVVSCGVPRACAHIPEVFLMLPRPCAHIPQGYVALPQAGARCAGLWGMLPRPCARFPRVCGILPRPCAHRAYGRVRVPQPWVHRAQVCVCLPQTALTSTHGGRMPPRKGFMPVLAIGGVLKTGIEMNFIASWNFRSAESFRLSTRFVAVPNLRP